jgi:Protein of unknown function (DUF2950)
MRWPDQTSERRLPETSNVGSRFAKPALLLVAVMLISAANTSAQTGNAATFPSADAAMQSLVAATKTDDPEALQRVFGPDYKVLFSGDQAEDRKDWGDFSSAVKESAKLRKDSDSKYTVLVGKDDWPMPIPLVREDNKWTFDAKSGMVEVSDRRVGEDELSAIETCKAYAVAQWEYFTEGDWDHDGVAEYAQRLISTPGKHDGLFWETGEGGSPSPLGELVANARAESSGAADASGAPDAGKTASKEEGPSGSRAPYHGYYFKILTGQGASAPGGKYSYIINGNMIAGYALVAYPADWGKSGVMTFIINQQGRVYEKNLGSNTATAASHMTSYNPDSTWKLVEAQP